MPPLTTRPIIQAEVQKFSTNDTKINYVLHQYNAMKYTEESVSIR